MNSTADSIKAGFRLVAGLLLAIVLLNLLSVLINTFSYGGVNFLVWVRFALLVGLCWAVYNGKVWARLVLGLLLLFNGVGALIAAAAFGGGFGLTVGSIGLLQFGGALGLFVMPQVNAYFEYAAAQN